MIYTRNTDSCHPIDCLCNVCRIQKHKPADVQEINVKKQLNYWIGDSKL